MPTVDTPTSTSTEAGLIDVVDCRGSDDSPISAIVKEFTSGPTFHIISNITDLTTIIDNQPTEIGHFLIKQKTGRFDEYTTIILASLVKHYNRVLVSIDTDTKKYLPFLLEKGKVLTSQIHGKMSRSRWFALMDELTTTYDDEFKKENLQVWSLSDKYMSQLTYLTMQDCKQFDDVIILKPVFRQLLEADHNLCDSDITKLGICKFVSLEFIVRIIIKVRFDEDPDPGDWTSLLKSVKLIPELTSLLTDVEIDDEHLAFEELYNTLTVTNENIGSLDLETWRWPTLPSNNDVKETLEKADHELELMYELLTE